MTGAACSEGNADHPEHLISPLIFMFYQFVMVPCSSYLKEIRVSSPLVTCVVFQFCLSFLCSA